MQKSVNYVIMAANKELYILDASVILKWFLPETEDHENASKVRSDYLSSDIVATIPHYAYAEIMNILKNKLSREEALSAFSFLLMYTLKDYPITLELASVAVELMEKFPGVSFYDAGYHALALQHGGTFITADKKYYEKTKKRGHIMLLKQYGKKR